MEFTAARDKGEGRKKSNNASPKSTLKSRYDRLHADSARRQRSLEKRGKRRSVDFPSSHRSTDSIKEELEAVDLRDLVLSSCIKMQVREKQSWKRRKEMPKTRAPSHRR